MPKKFPHSSRHLPSPWALTLIALTLFLAGLLTGYALTPHQSPPPLDSSLTETPPLATSPSTSPATWSVATYNIKNFFDTYDNPYTADEGTKPKPPAELAALAQAITDLNADVLILQEVEAGGFLKKFTDTNLPNLNYTAIIDESTEDPRGITIAALSRFPILRIVSHRLTPLDPTLPPTPENRFARDLLRLDILPRPNYPITLYALHLKSKLAEDPAHDPTLRRLAEARRARQIIEEEIPQLPSARFILLGDCNDSADSPPIQILSALNAPGPLFDTLAYLPPEQQITFLNPQYKEPIDHLWLSPALKPQLVPPGALILRGGPYEKASDHRPVKAQLYLP